MLAWLTALWIAANFPIVYRLVEQWSYDADVGHGFFVPLVSGYIAWQRRDEIAKLKLKTSWWGVPVMLFGALQGYLGSLAAEQFLQRTSLIELLLGAILLLGGMKLIRALAFPLLLLPFMIPIPSVIYNQITFPLQLFASRVAEVVLGWLNIPVLRDGNVLELASQKLQVAEACSGIRSLLSLTFFSLIYAHYFDTKPWMRQTLFLVTIPVAILANAARVTITGILSEINPELARGFFHEFEGFVIVIIAGVIMVGAHFAINQVYNRVGGKKKVAYA